MPDISVIADDKAAIYGVEWGALRAGHLDTLQSVVQNKGKILTLLNVKPDSRYSRTELSTNILLPYKNNEVLVNGVVITNLASGASTVIKVGDTVSVRKGTTVASVRIISSQSCAGSILNMVLRVDDPTKQEARLALFHYQNPSVAPPLNCSARSVLLFEANDIGNIADIRAATVTQSTENNILDVSATWGGTVLRVQKNLINDDVINRRYGNALQAFSVLNVE
jgi:hypothetical protein